MPSPIEQRRVWLFFGTLSMFPMAALILMGSLVLRTRWALGYWPSYNRPDPSTLDFPVHQGLAFVAFLLAAAAPLGFASVVFLCPGLLAAWRTSVKGLLVFALIFGSYHVWSATDPGGFLDWFFD